MRKIKRTIVIFGVFSLLIGVCSAAFVPVAATQAADDAGDIQDDIKKTEKQLEAAQKKEAALKKNLGQITGSLVVTKQLIARTMGLLSDTESVISGKQAEIAAIENEIVLQKHLLQALIQSLYDNRRNQLAEMILDQKALQVHLVEGGNLITIQEKISVIADELEAAHDTADEERTVLEDAKLEHERLLRLKSEQEKSLTIAKIDTQADLTDQQQIISRLSKELAELQGDLSQLTGKSYNAKDIREAVEFASKRTGVPEGVLYGFLKMETNLGANTGQCTYDEVEKDALARYRSLLKKNKKWQASIDTLMRRKGLFVKIVKDLGYSKDKKVSCNPRSYIGQGGAMGVPQFMSDVWNAYAAQISTQTGNKNPDPWDLTDGVMAMALKLKKAGATSSSASVIRSSSISYLGGFSAGYYNGIVYWSKNYKLLFK